MQDLKAVISTAGFGTRFFPIAKAVTKSMLPIMDRPVLDYLVEDCVRAGVSSVAFVTSPQDVQIRAYFTPDARLHASLEARGWSAKLRPLLDMHDRFRDIEFVWLTQPDDGKYGTAVPPMLAREFVGNSDFLLLTGDDFVLRDDGGSDLRELREARSAAAASGAMAVAEVPEDHVDRYGIVQTRDADGYAALAGLVEKPARAVAPSRLASISRFLLTADFFECLDRLRADDDSGEYLSTTALLDYAVTHDVVVHPLRGTYYDCGTPEGWLAANIAVAAQRHVK
jgi:UTP--glucose-1-phosphate uridylyltransferase